MLILGLFLKLLRKQLHTHWCIAECRCMIIGPLHCITTIYSIVHIITQSKISLLLLFTVWYIDMKMVLGRIF